MKHFHQGSRRTPGELVARYEKMIKSGTPLSFSEREFLSILDYYEQENKLERATSLVDHTLQVFRTSGKLHFRKARLLMYKKAYEGAFESLDRAEFFEYSPFEIGLLRIRIYCYIQEYEVARTLLTKMKITYFPTPKKISRVYTMEALMYERMEDYHQMFDSLKEAIMEHPKNEDALGKMYLCVELSGKFQESATLHRQVIDLEPYSFIAWFNLGHAWYATGEHYKALEAFEYATIINDKFELAYLDCAELCFSLQKWAKALPYYLKLLHLIEPDEELLCRIGQCYEYLGAYEKAKVYLYRALAINPKDPEIYFHIGQCYAKGESWESAMHFFKQAVKLNPDSDEYIAALAHNHVQLGYAHRAIPLYKKATTLLPEISSNWVALTQIYISRNKVGAALTLLEEAFRHSYDAPLLYCQAACQFISGNKTIAMDTLREGLLEDFDAHRLLFEICPELEEDRKVSAILRYYRSEPVERPSVAQRQLIG